MRTFQTQAELAALVGQEVAVSDWTTVTQEQINLFAQATGDHQWIHVDVERARAGPFGAPIAHGFLTLSLLPAFFQTALHVVQTGMGVNYGLNKVRFTSPVPVGWTVASAFVPATRTPRTASFVSSTSRSESSSWSAQPAVPFAPSSALTSGAARWSEQSWS